MKREAIVLLHGLNRSSMSMVPIALAARHRRYTVINWRYRSTRRSIAGHADALARELAPRLRNFSRVHFITHSLGGIIVRRFLDATPLPNLGRVVMLAPPNGGSEVADVLHPLLGAIMKPLAELTTAAAVGLPESHFPVGVIAGSRSHIRLFSRWMHDVPNDGVVSVERTRLARMSGFVVLPHTHTFLPWSRNPIAQAMTFIERGAFAP
jgi:triacylglycerol lipase